MDKLNKKFVFYAVLIFIIFLISASLLQYHIAGKQKAPKKYDFTEFVSAVKSKKVKSVEISGMQISGKLNDGKSFTTHKEYGYELTPLLIEHKIPFKNTYVESSVWAEIARTFFILIMVIGGIFVLLWILGRAQRKSFGGKSNLKQYSERKMEPVTFSDVAGIDEAKEELQEIVQFLKNKSKFGRLGGRVPKGALLMGPPGTGKTLLARAVAGEARVPFLWMSGSEFTEMFVGVGAMRARELFEKARKSAPCVVFIDEVDAIAKQRGAGLGNNHNENEQTLNQILTEMDGFEKDTGIIVIAATNRPDVLDPAILRPGRFDRQVMVPRPDLNGREKILQVHTKNKILSESVDLKVLARGTPGASGADLENLANEAALNAEREDKIEIEMADFEIAWEKMLMGKEKPTVISEEEKKVIAFHEAGHAIMTLACDNADPLYKVSIIPRGMALGVTVSLPTKDRFLLNTKQASEQILIFLGGRVAEELFLGDVTNGAANDLQRATEVIKDMVSKWGMDSEFGLASFGNGGENPFLGKSLALNSGISQQSQYDIEKRTKDILQKSYELVKERLEKANEEVIKLANELLEKETLSVEQIKILLS